MLGNLILVFKNGYPFFLKEKKREKRISNTFIHSNKFQKQKTYVYLYTSVYIDIHTRIDIHKSIQLAKYVFVFENNK